MLHSSQASLWGDCPGSDAPSDAQIGLRLRLFLPPPSLELGSMRLAPLAVLLVASHAGRVRRVEHLLHCTGHLGGRDLVLSQCQAGQLLAHHVRALDLRLILKGHTTLALLRRGGGLGGGTDLGRAADPAEDAQVYLMLGSNSHDAHTDERRGFWRRQLRRWWLRELARAAKSGPYAVGGRRGASILCVREAAPTAPLQHGRSFGHHSALIRILAPHKRGREEPRGLAPLPNRLETRHPFEDALHVEVHSEGISTGGDGGRRLGRRQRLGRRRRLGRRWRHGRRRRHGRAGRRLWKWRGAERIAPVRRWRLL
mmetsp:Transcript_38445/g.101380  ORF Transcript_38445/g.101380 Transcript_38445/m.101380 type:complete len:312 (+) Transcript_38445:461-1396(+)